MDVDWGTILTSVFGSGGLGVAAFQYFSKRASEKKTRHIQNSYARIAEVYRALESIRAATRANRVCVLKTENGGGIPAPGCDVKSSVLYENADPKMPRELQSCWQKVELNGVWAPLLHCLAVEGFANLTPNEKMGPHFDFLAESDCAKVHFVLIKLSEPAMFYLSVHLPDNIELSAYEASTMYQGARHIRQLFDSRPQLIEE